jgi:hypothetical protein
MSRNDGALFLSSLPSAAAAHPYVSPKFGPHREIRLSRSALISWIVSALSGPSGKWL